MVISKRRKRELLFVTQKAIKECNMSTSCSVLSLRTIKASKWSYWIDIYKPWQGSEESCLTNVLAVLPFYGSGGELCETHKVMIISIIALKNLYIYMNSYIGQETRQNVYMYIFVSVKTAWGQAWWCGP